MGSCFKGTVFAQALVAVAAVAVCRVHGVVAGGGLAFLPHGHGPVAVPAPVWAFETGLAYLHQGCGYACNAGQLAGSVLVAVAEDACCEHPVGRPYVGSVEGGARSERIRSALSPQGALLAGGDVADGDGCRVGEP